MSTESEQNERLMSSDWTMSFRAQKSGEYDALCQEANISYRENGGLSWWSRVGEPHYADPEEEDEYEVAEWVKFGNDLFPHSKIFQNSSERDRVEMTRAWWGDAYWLYDAHQITDGLFPHTVYRERYAFEKMSRFVMSGLLGDHLLRNRKQLRKVAEQLDESPLDTAILVGGAALAMHDLPQKLHETGATYLGAPSGMYVPETWTGGDAHGDFRTSRRFRPVHDVTTSLRPERKHPFMPVFSSVDQVGSYHGTESDITGALLSHLVKRVGMDPQKIRQDLFEKLQVEKIHVGGNFGDYGDSDGKRQAGQLRYRLEQEGEWTQPQEQLFNGVVTPWSNFRFTIVSENEGVKLINSFEEGEARDTLLLPNDEIIDYITTLIRGGGGRTAPQAMTAVINALVEPDAV